MFINFANVCEPLPVEVEVPSPVDAPHSRTAMADASGVSATTLKNWLDRDDGEGDAALAIEGPDGTTCFTWRRLVAFCMAHPHLSKSRVVLRRFAELFPDGAASDSTPPAGTESTVLRGQVVSSGGRPAHPPDGATLRVVVEELKGAVDQHAGLVATAKRLAADASRTHDELTRRLDELEAVIAAGSGA